MRFALVLLGWLLVCAGENGNEGKEPDDYALGEENEGLSRDVDYVDDDEDLVREVVPDSTHCEDGTVTSSSSTLLAASTESPLIVLSSQNISEHIKPPSHFGVFLLFATRGEEYYCASCSAVDDALSRVARAYWQVCSQSHKFFFVFVEVSGQKEFFIESGVGSLPYVAYLPPHPKAVDKLSHSLVEISLRGLGTAQDLANAFERASGIQIPLLPHVRARPHQQDGSDSLLFGLTLAMVVAVCGMLASRLLPFLREHLEPFELWALAASVFVVLMMTGTMYDIVKGPNLIAMHPQTHEIMFFYPGVSQQFIFEGVAVAVLYCIIIFCLLTLYKKSGESNDDSVQTLLVCVCLFVSVYCMSRLQSFYLHKTGRG